MTVGRKAWVMFPPSVTPPGVFVSADRAEVEAPLSLAGQSFAVHSSASRLRRLDVAEWFISYYKEAKLTYGARAKDPKTRGKMTEGICEAGEIFFVPSGYWHSTSLPALPPALRILTGGYSRGQSRTVNRRHAKLRLEERVTESPQLYEISSGASIRLQIKSSSHL